MSDDIRQREAKRLSSAEAKLTVIRLMARQWSVADQMTGDAASPHDATLTEVGKALLAALEDTGTAEPQRVCTLPVPRWAVEALASPATIQEKGRAERALKRALAALDGTEETEETDRG